MSIYKIITRFVLGYLLLAALWYGYQQLFFFQPKRIPVSQALSLPVKIKFKTAHIPFDANTVLDVVKFEPERDTALGVVLFFHGNRFNVEHYSTYAPYFLRNGYACWMVDYPGYGRSSGEMSIDLLQQTGEQLYKMAAAVYKPDQIIVYGKSLGTGIATYVASKKVCGGMILETPYYSLSTLAGNYLFFLPVNLLAKYNIASNEQLKRSEEPVLIFHGTSDELIPVDNMARLLQYTKTSDKLYMVEGATHNTIPEFSLYHHALDSMLKAVDSVYRVSLY